MNRCLLALPISAIALLFVCSFPSQAGDWNQWRGSSRDGHAVDSPALIDALPEAGLEPQWLSEAEIPSGRSGGWGSPAIADGKVYIFTHQRLLKDGAEVPKKKFPWLAPDKRTGMTPQEYAEYEVNRRDEDEALGKYYRYAEVTHCIDAATGKTLWTNDETSVYTRFLQSGTPAVIDGKVYVLGAGLKARCIDAESGKTLWTTQLPGEFRDEFLQSSFVVHDGIAVVFARQLFGLNAKSGKILWSAGDEGSNLHTSPTIWERPNGSVAISNIGSGKTIGVNLASGEIEWEIETSAGHATPVVAGDLLLTYGSSRKAGLRCFQLKEDAEPEEKWVFQGAADSGSSPVVAGKNVFVQGERRMACVELETGEEVWRTTLDLENPRYASPVAADGKLFYAFGNLICCAADADKFQSLMNAKIDGSGLLADEAVFRKRLEMDKLETTAEGQAEAEKLWQKTFRNAGPLTCATPAIADGRMFVRLKDRLACYDLRAEDK